MDGSILVVDDDREVQAYLQLALAVTGRPVVADDGQGVSLEASPRSRSSTCCSATRMVCR
ncbi:MAG: hypothetical protein R3F43_08885 [bacterium]